MGDQTDQANKSLHPVYTITDITRKVRVLDGVKVSYSSWVKLFQLHARGYKVMNHIDGTRAPAKEDPTYASWSEIDAIVLQWIYGTLLDDLLLNDVDHPVGDQRLVLKLVRGLLIEYDTVGAYINQSLPSWETACSMLQLEYQRQTARENHSAPTAFAAMSNEPQKNDQPIHRRRGSNRPTNTRRPHQQTQPTTSSNRGRTPRTNTNPSGSNQFPHWAALPAKNNTPPNWAYWAPPPYLFPTQQGWVQPWINSPLNWNHFQAPGSSGSKQQTNPLATSSAQAHLDEFDPLQPTQIGEALQAMNINNEDAPWFMDSGASDHLTSDQGKITNPMSFCPIGSIFVGNGARMPVLGSGHNPLPYQNRPLHLKDVLYTPNIIKNLISIRKFTIDNYISVDFDPYGFSVKEYPSGKIISRHNSSIRLYPLTYPVTPPKEPVAFASISQDPWHDRLGHPGLSVFDFLVSNKIIVRNKRAKTIVCNSCQLSKHKRFAIF
ncbi:uncharacterized protein LOC143571939 [Bidens hawaiensis]|uniref:uncharacterized protein LOC143571939 n=1 Tax=Bidens hawaiensis TaxID=980011 RepID=UPI00404ACD2D